MVKYKINIKSFAIVEAESEAEARSKDIKEDILKNFEITEVKQDLGYDLGLKCGCGSTDLHIVGDGIEYSDGAVQVQIKCNKCRTCNYKKITKDLYEKYAPK